MKLRIDGLLVGVCATCCLAGNVLPVSKSDAVARATITYAPAGLLQRVELPVSPTGTGPHDFYSLFANWPLAGDVVYGVGIAGDKKLFYKDAVVTADGPEHLSVGARVQFPAGLGNKVNYIGVTFMRGTLEKLAVTGTRLHVRSSKGSLEFTIPGWMFSALIEAADAKDYGRAAEARREQRRKDAREAYLEAHPELPERIKKAISAEKIVLGMSAQDTRASWGAPSKVNKTVNMNGVSEQWVYGDTYVYFQNGTLTSWQSSE
jgi:hypothetical protein